MRHVRAHANDDQGSVAVTNGKVLVPHTNGKLYCLDAYLTEPGHLQHMKWGMIKSLRVIEGVPEPF